MRLKTSKSKNTTLFYIIKDYAKNGKRSTKIVKKIGNTDDVIKMAGSADYKTWLKNYVKDFDQKYKNTDAVLIKKDGSKLIKKDTNCLFNVGYIFLKHLYYDLAINEIANEISNKYKFQFNFNEILSYLIYARIIFPSSKLETFKQCQNFLEQPTFSLQHEYRSLDYIAKETDFIQSKLFENSKNLINRNSKIIYYDCTNYFFEIDKQDDFRRYGVSKEHRPNPIVGMGMFMDADGIPISFNVYPGNESEINSILPEENKIINNFDIDKSKIILCTDAGFSTDPIKKENIGKNRGFIITQSLKKLKEKYKDEIFDNCNWRLVGDKMNVYNLDDFENDDELKAQYYDKMFYKIIDTETKSVKQDLIVTFCFKYRDYNRGIRNNQIERANKAIDNGDVGRKGKNQNDYKRFINSLNSTDAGELAENVKYVIDTDKIIEEEKYDGYYAVSTNVIGEVGNILKIIKRRWEIEESFRIMKSDFLARPVNLSREDRIKAHFMTCFISLLIYRILEKKLNYKYTINEILGTLKDMNVYESKGDGYIPVYKRTDLTDDLHDLCNIRTDYEINSYQYFKKIFNTFK